MPPSCQTQPSAAAALTQYKDLLSCTSFGAFMIFGF